MMERSPRAPVLRSIVPETETDHSGGRVRCASTGSAAIEDFDKKRQVRSVVSPTIAASSSGLL
jgi:hypothetical protein